MPARVVLTREEVAALSVRIHSGGADGLVARNDLVVANLPLVTVVVERSAQRLAHPFDDLFQEGAIALMTATWNFNPSKGFAFSTYAYRSISMALGRWAMEQGVVRVPYHVSRLRVRVEKAEQELIRRGERCDFIAACELAGLSRTQVLTVWQGYAAQRTSEYKGDVEEPER